MFKSITTFLPLVIFLFVTVPHSHAQSVSKIDSKIAALLNKVNYWAEYDYIESKDDSLADANNKLDSFLRKVSASLPVSTKFPFAEQNGLDLAIAADNKIKVYSWDSRLGGSMRRYNSLAAYQTRNGIKTEEFLDLSDSIASSGHMIYSEGGYYFDEMVPIKANDHTTTYLLIGSSVESTSERGMIVIALRIVNNELIQIPFFKTSTQNLKIISYSYNSVSGSIQGETPVMHLSKDHKQFFIPIVSGLYNEQITNKYLVYTFDGSNFIYEKNVR